MSRVSREKCPKCGMGFLVKETWAEDGDNSPENFYCNNCFKRKDPDNVIMGRNGAFVLEDNDEHRDNAI